MLWLYRILILLFAPFALWRLHRRAAPAYRQRWRERLGYLDAVEPGAIWVHAASVGEVNAGRRLIEALLDRGQTVIISTVTATGAGRVEQLFGARVTHRFLPFDTPGAIRRWLAAVQPRLVLMLETELWPVLYRAVACREIPLLLVNARLSTRSVRRYRRLRRTVAATLAQARLIACQTATDADRFLTLGAPPERIRVTGNLKFDLEPPTGLSARAAELRAAWGERPVWVAGSTHAGEETALLAAHARICRKLPDALLVLAPRHPERAAAVADAIAGARLDYVSFGQPVPAQTAVVLVDRIGVLMACYAAAEVAFVGGSLTPVGGHNLLEPAALRRPVISGPHLDAQRLIAGPMAGAGALVRVNDAAELEETLLELLRDQARRAALGEAAYRFVASGRGALKKTLVLMDDWLLAHPPASAGD